MDFSGKRVLVTGGSRGIGKATAIFFASKGATVVISFKENEKAAKEVMTCLSGSGHSMLKADTSRPDDCRFLVEEAIKSLGKLDVVINNAGIFLKHPVTSTSYDEWQAVWKKTLDVNLTGVANICFHAAKHMISQGGGKIINVSSRGAFRGEPEHTAYGASKAGLNSFSQSLAQELAPYNILVGVVAPGFVATDMSAKILDGPEGNNIKKQSPLLRVARPEEVAYAIAVFADENAGYMTGGIIDVNGASYLRS